MNCLWLMRFLPLTNCFIRSPTCLAALLLILQCSLLVDASSCNTTDFCLGEHFSCFVWEPDSQVFCFGSNDYGQLGLGDTKSRGQYINNTGQNSAAIDLGSNIEIGRVHCGRESVCVVTKDAGKMKCWGWGDSTHTGYGDSEDRGDEPGEMGDNLPYVDLGTDFVVATVGSGHEHRCVSSLSQRLKCFGAPWHGPLGYEDSYFSGQMGDNLPYVNLGTNRTVLSLCTGYRHNCVLLHGGDVKCFGWNEYGQLGLADGSGNDVGDEAGQMGDNLPVINLGTGLHVTQVACAGLSTCALLNDSTVKCWGANGDGQLGIGDTDGRGTAVGSMGDNLPRADLNGTIVEIAGFENHFCARLAGGYMKCWGQNTYSELGYGDGNDRGDGNNDMGANLPVLDFGDRKVVKLRGYGTADHTCAELDNGEVRCWGRNDYGQLGLGSTEGSISSISKSVDYCNCSFGSTRIGSTNCSECSTGKYAFVDDEDVAYCTSCAFGTYANDSDSAESISSCTECEIGRYANAYGMTSCLDCPVGKFSNSTGASICRDCGIGLYSNSSGSKSCPSCPLGRYGNATGLTICTDCDPGEYVSMLGSSSCQNCIGGRFSEDFGESECKNCSIGLYQDEEGQTACKNCSLGRFGDENGLSECSECLSGWYMDKEGSFLCKSCPEGAYQNETGESQCILCETGAYSDSSNSTTCKSCELGRFSSSTGSVNCTECDFGYYQASTGSTSCDECPEGRYGNESGAESTSTCVECGYGSYNNESGSWSCKSCGLGFYSDLTGSDSDDDCIECPAGRYSIEEESSECKNCSAGMYQDQEGQTVCKNCTLGRIGDEIGLSECSDCLSGWYMDVEGASVCKSCPEGAYQNETGESECKVCEPGSYSDSSNSTTCESCEIGRFSSNAGSENCSECVVGYYQNETGESECKLCEAGSYSDFLNSTTCKSCEVGRFSSSTGSVNCTECDFGYYQASTGSTSCDECPEGRYGNESGAESSSICVECGYGSYNDESGSSSCKSCGLGFYSDLSGSDSENDCTECPAGRYSMEEESSSCIECESGTYTAALRQTLCLSCSAGTFAEGEGTTLCSECPLGFFSSIDGANECDSCLAGQYAGSTGSTSCEECDPGKYSDSSGSSLCTSCAVGFYSADYSSSICTECPNGATTSFEGLYETIGASSIRNCVCGVSTYGKPWLEEGDCKDCPDGGLCETLNLSWPLADSGYVEVVSDSGNASYFECSPSEACDGGACATGYDGEVCERCAQGYYKVDLLCHACGEDSGAVKMFLMCIGALLYFLLALRSGRPSSTKTYSLKVIVTWAQIISLFSLYPVDWNEVTLDVFDAISLVNLNMDLAAPECVFSSWTYWDRWLLKLCLPLIGLVFLLIWFCYQLWMEKFRPDSTSIFTLPFTTLLSFGMVRRSSRKISSHGGDKYKRTRFVWAFVSLLEVGYTFLSSTVVDPFVCREQSDGKRYMLSLISQECFTGEWMNKLPFMIAGMVVYVLGIPITFTLIVYNYRHSRYFSDTFGTLTLPFHDKYYWWAVLDLWRRLVLVSLLNFSSVIGDETIQAFVAIIVLLGFLAVQSLVSPYRRKCNNALSMFWIVATLVCFSCASMLSLSTSGDLSPIIQTMLICSMMGVAILSIYFFRNEILDINVVVKFERTRSNFLEYEASVVDTLKRGRVADVSKLWITLNNLPVKDRIEVFDQYFVCEPEETVRDMIVL